MNAVAGSKAELLRRAEQTVLDRRAADLRDLQDALEWCGLNSGDPQAEPNAVPVAMGGDHLTRYGGDGTPDVSELCVGEYAIARRAGVRATANLMGDALDLAYRFPQMWAKAPELLCEVWVLRKVASMARRLTKDQCVLVDEAVAEALAESPGRILAIAEAKVIEADTRAHLDRVLANNRRRGVWFPKPLPGEQLQWDNLPGSQRLAARLKPGQAADLDHTLDRIADYLADEYAVDADDDMPTRDQLRAEALAFLANPQAAAAMLAEAEAEPENTIVPQDQARKDRTARKAAVCVHVDADVLAEGEGVARVEDLGPILVSQLSELLDGAEITLAPVIDLRDLVSVNSYEHPGSMKTRTEHRTAGCDVFPHSTHAAGRGRLDHDHPVAYVPGGPPGQTSDLNDAPLTRRHHRHKTHLAYQVRQTGPGHYEWTTPHGLRRVVDQTGTHILSP
jgi:hypothetical protein